MAEHIMSITGITRSLRHIKSHAEWVIEYIESEFGEVFEYGKKYPFYFFDNDILYDHLDPIINKNNIENIKSLIYDGMEARAFVILEKNGRLNIKFFMTVENANRRSERFSLFATVTYVKFEDEEYTVDAYTHPIEVDEVDIGPSLTWLSLMH